MIRTLVLAASAVALFAAAPAGAAEVRIKTAGKTQAELRAEVTKAASTVCWAEVRGTALASYVYPSCVKASVDKAVAQLNGQEDVAAAPAAVRAR